MNTLRILLIALCLSAALPTTAWPAKSARPSIYCLLPYKKNRPYIAALGAFALSTGYFGNSPASSLYAAAAAYGVTTAVMTFPSDKDRVACILEFLCATVAASSCAFVVNNTVPLLINYLTEQ